MLHPYPQQLSQGLEAILRTTTIIRTGDIVRNKAELGACVYTAQGVAMKTGLGDFVEPALGAITDEANCSADQEAELTAAALDLRAAVYDLNGIEPQFAADAKPNWREIIKALLPLLLQLL